MERQSHFTSEFSGSANTTRRHVTIAYAFLSVDLLDRKHRLPGLAAPAREPFWGFGRFRSTDMAFPQVATAVYEESSQDHRLFAPDSRFSASGFAKPQVAQTSCRNLVCARPTITPQNRLKRALRSERCRSRIFNRPRRFPATSIARFKHLDRNKTARPHRSMTAWGTQGESEIHWAPHVI